MNAPRVSVVIPAYRSEDTIVAALEHLGRQTFRDFEVVLVDSSPDEETAQRAAGFGWIRFERSGQRMYPHEARERGVELSRGELLVFTDPDVYADAGWLDALVSAYDERKQVMVGALRCHGERLVDLGIHLCKFSKFLPGGRIRPVDVPPTANLLLSRADFDAAGGLRGDRFLADVQLGRALEALGRRLLFVPGAIVDHHHTQTVREFMIERYSRGKLYGAMRAGWLPGQRQLLTLFAASVLPVRIITSAVHVMRHAARAGQLPTLAVTFPLVMAGHAAAIAGEATEYARALLGRRRA